MLISMRKKALEKLGSLHEGASVDVGSSPFALPRWGRGGNVAIVKGEFLYA